jgi:ubiquinone biosynthesis protein UbiJ
MLAGWVEGLLNRAIDASSVATERAGAIEGKRLAVHIDGLSRCFVLAVRGGRVTLAEGDAVTADVTIKAPPLELLKLVGADSVQGFKGAAVELHGDVHTAEAFAALLKVAAPDIERELAGWIGDLPAHAIGTRARGLERWMRRSSAALEADMSEYLQEESGLLPLPEQVLAFCGEVDRLRDDVERAAARLERLARDAAR